MKITAIFKKPIQLRWLIAIAALAALIKAPAIAALCAIAAAFSPKSAFAALNASKNKSLEEKIAPMLLRCHDVEALADGLGVTVGDVKSALEGLSIKIACLTGQATQTAVSQIAREYCLTERETMVLEALASGKQNGEIAFELYISESTVKFHVGNVLKKLSLKNRRQVVTKLLEAHG